MDYLAQAFTAAPLLVRILVGVACCLLAAVAVKGAVKASDWFYRSERGVWVGLVLVAAAVAGVYLAGR